MRSLGFGRFMGAAPSLARESARRRGESHKHDHVDKLDLCEHNGLRYEPGAEKDVFKYTQVPGSESLRGSTLSEHAGLMKACSSQS